MAVTQQPGNGEWQHGLFSCCESVGDCLLAFCFGPCYNIIATTAAGESCCCGILTCLFPIGMCCVRGNVRQARGIDGSCLGDLCATWCCHCCAAIQIKREFDN